MSIKLHQLRAFTEVANQGGIRAASRVLNLSQPAVTKAIKELEECLGAALFHRGVQGITLTECGENFLQHARLILRELDIAQEDIQQRLGSVSGQVSVGMGASIACSLAPEVIARFRKEYPQVKVRIIEGQVEAHLERLRRGELDFSINTAHPAHADTEFQLEKLLDMEFKVLLRKGHPCANATTLEELANCDWIMPTVRTSYHRWLMEIMAQKGIQPAIVITCESYIPSLGMIAKTDCVGVMSETAMQHYAHADDITAIQLRDALPLATYYLVQRKASPLTPVAARLAQLFRMQSRAQFGS